MSISLNTNTNAIFTRRSFENATDKVADSTMKLSSGHRINKGADDAAGLSISKGFETLLKSTTNSKRNISDGISMLQTMDAALASIGDELDSIRELTVRANNGVYSDEQRDVMQRELVESINTIGSIAECTKFGQSVLLDGSQDRNIHYGVKDSDQLTLLFQSGVAANQGIEISLTTDETALGSITEGIDTTGRTLETMNLGSINVVAADDATFAVSSGEANYTMSDIDKMIENVTRMRTNLGSYDNALGSHMEYQEAFTMGMSQVHSNIFDTDVAAESSNLIKSQLVQNSATSILTQSNSQGSIALNLIP